MTTSLPILGLTRDAFTGADGRLADYRRVFRDGALPDGASLPDVAVARVQEEGETTKFALRLPDGVEVESVILPQTGTTGRRRVTLCVSSQVGCAMGCTFCETAQMGLLRNLSVEEIVAQWHVARFEFDERAARGGGDADAENASKKVQELLNTREKLFQ